MGTRRSDSKEQGDSGLCRIGLGTAGLPRVDVACQPVSSFRFAVIGDRMGGAVEGVFGQILDETAFIKLDVIITVGGSHIRENILRGIFEQRNVRAVSGATIIGISTPGATESPTLGYPALASHCPRGKAKGAIFCYLLAKAVGESLTVRAVEVDMVMPADSVTYDDIT